MLLVTSRKMAHCFSACASRCRMLVTAHQFLRNTSTKYRRELRRESCTNNGPQFSLLHINNRSLTRYTWRDDYIAPKYTSFLYTRYDYFSSHENKTKVSDEEKPEEKLSLMKKFKVMFKKYWYVLVPVHVVTSAVWLGGFYYLAASGINVPELLESFGAPDSWVESVRSSKAGNAVITYTLYKISTPIRYTVTIGGTTIAISYLTKWGWIKPVPNREEFKRMYEEQKDAFKDFTTSYQDKIQLKKDDLLKKKEELKEHYTEAKEGLQKSVIDSQKDFTQGVKHLKAECKHIGGLLAKRVKDGYNKKADYVAQVADDKTKSKKNR